MKDQEKLAELEPRRSDLLSVTKGKGLVETETDWTVAPQSEKQFLEMQEMFEPSVRFQTERSGKINSEIYSVSVRTQEGRVEHVPAHLEAQAVAKRGLKPVIRWGRGKHYRFTKDTILERKPLRTSAEIRGW